MPCSDITEILSLYLNADDTVDRYQLTKKSCGRAVGEQSLVIDWIRGRDLESVRLDSTDHFLDHFGTEDETEEFLLLKHFFAIRAAISVFLGDESGGANDPFAVGSVCYGPDGTEIEVHLKIETLTEKIKSCGRCGSGCGRKKAKSSAA